MEMDGEKWVEILDMKDQILENIQIKNLNFIPYLFNWNLNIKMIIYKYQWDNLILIQD